MVLSRERRSYENLRPTLYTSKGRLIVFSPLQVGLDASQELIRADKMEAEEEESPQKKEVKESSAGEDTVDEAPSIVDEIPSQSGSSSSGSSSVEESASSSGSSGSTASSRTEEIAEDQSSSQTRWSTAENVVVMVGADMKLKDAHSEGKEVKNSLPKH